MLEGLDLLVRHLASPEAIDCLYWGAGATLRGGPCGRTAGPSMQILLILTRNIQDLNSVQHCHLRRALTVLAIPAADLPLRLLTVILQLGSHRLRLFFAIFFVVFVEF